MAIAVLIILLEYLVAGTNSKKAKAVSLEQEKYKHVVLVKIDEPVRLKLSQGAIMMRVLVSTTASSIPIIQVQKCKELDEFEVMAKVLCQIREL